MKRFLVPLLLAPLVLGGCTTSFGGGPRAGATREQIDACEARADEIYALRHPADTMRADNEAAALGSPFSAGTGRSETQLLAGRHAREALVNDCLNGQTGTAPTNVKRPKPQS
ncbi:MAG: hypothetical protein KGK10_05605 [Rhodospirillales bacterium]|nr:hypothetical protein [Rhodospirillales bacterium]